MGTRHLIAAQLDGQYKIAQYSQWDGYQTPLETGERFANDEGLEKTEGYYPVRHAKTYQLDSLPTDEQFLSDLEPDDPEL